MEKYLIIGLGNIGEEYAHTRHNIGFDVVDAFVKRHKASFVADRLADRAEFRWKGKVFICLKPTTYMNLSGKSVKYWLDKEKLEMNRLLVIVDEIALPLSKLRLRPGGSAAGHNGLKSIEEYLLSKDYPRLRFGIGNDYPKGKQIEYVLGPWAEHQKLIVNQKIEYCNSVIESFATAGISLTMNEVNKLDFEG